MKTCTKPTPGWTCSRNEGHPGACAARRQTEDPGIPVPEIGNWDDVERWIGYHHRMLVQDAARFNRVEERLRELEQRPWWRRRRN